jgi:Protein of unknown function (DUF2721)
MFSQAAAPAFLLAGIAAFISILLSRHTAILAQLRNLSDTQGKSPNDSERENSISHLKRRAYLLHKAIYLALLAGIFTVLLLIVMALFTFLGLQHIFGGALLFALATILFTASLIRFAQEVKIALHEIDNL